MLTKVSFSAPYTVLLVYLNKYINKIVRLPQNAQANEENMDPKEQRRYFKEMILNNFVKWIMGVAKKWP